jgi:hypothetical protein
MTDLASVTELMRTRRSAIEHATTELIDQLGRRHVHVPYAVAFVAVVHAVAEFQITERWEAGKDRPLTGAATH